MSNPPNQPRPGAPPGHVGHAHFWERFLSRRRFLQAAAGTTGVVLSSGLGWPGRALAGDKKSPPKPIPETIQPFPDLPDFIHHILPGPVDQGHEPSQITDFNGLVGLCRITGSGTEKGMGFGKLNFQADMGFMKGVYVGEDGRHHRATFAFI
jgi:hypothetical protein